MHYREEWLSLPLEARLTYQPSENLFFINFEGLTIRRLEDIENVRRAVEERLEPVGRKVAAIVNYDNFRILPICWTIIPTWSKDWRTGFIPALPATPLAPSCT